MMHSAPDLPTLFRPNDEDLSAEAREQIQLYRLLTLLGILLLPLFGLFSSPVPGTTDPMWGRLGAAGLLAGLFGASYGSKRVRQRYVVSLRGILYVVMGGFAVLAALNHFGDGYETSLLLVYALLIMVVWAGARSMQPVLRFGGFGLLVALAAAAIGPVPAARSLVVLASMGTVAAVEMTIIQASLVNRNKLRDREERLRSITENVSDGIYRSVPGDGIVYANQAFAEMFGYDSVDDVLQLDPSVLYNNSEEREQRLQDLKKKRSFEAHEIEFRRKDGTTFTGLLSGTVVRGPDGEVKCYDGAITDITEQKEAEQALRAERDRFETLFESLPTPVARCVADGERALVADVNQAFETVFGVEASTAEGRDLDALLASGSNGNDAHEHDAWIPEKKIHRAEVQRQAADGRRDFRLQVAGRTREDGSPEAYTIYTDITEQKKAERTLREEQRVLRRMYHITADRDASFESKVHRLLDLGREYLGLPFGFLTRISEGQQEIVCAAGSHPLLRQGATCPLSEAYCRKTIEQESLLAVQNAPSEGWAEDPAYDRFELGSYIGAQIRLEEEDYGTFCFAADGPRDDPFSEREKTFMELLTRWASYELKQRRDKERLRHKNERLDSFASVLSHDLRNPLSTAMINLDLARETDASSHLIDIGHALDRMDRIIQDVLTLTRSGDIDSEELSPVRLPSAVEASWAQVDTARATLQTDTGAVVRADERRLKRLLENLFRNAVEHGGEDVAVRVGDLPTGFFVEDDGPGIPPEKREAVFGEGYSSNDDGTGLGLSIVETVADAHDWTLSVVEGRAGGARFEVEGTEIVDAADRPPD